MSDRRRYANPPIEEAVCEIRFQPGDGWNLTIPGKLHAAVGDDYPGTPREQKRFDVELDVRQGKPLDLRYGEGLVSVQLVTRDGKRMLGVGRDVLSVHMLRPYQTPDAGRSGGWDEFRPRISRALDAYWGVAKPAGVLHTAIRYINKIIVPYTEMRAAEYLRCALPGVEGIPDLMRNFVSRAEYEYDDGVRLVLSHGLASAPPGHSGLLLDIDVICLNTEPTSKSDTMARISDLREREREAFEATITERARALFDGDLKQRRLVDPRRPCRCRANS